jgi:hypothetical protein
MKQAETIYEKEPGLNFSIEPDKDMISKTRQGLRISSQKTNALDKMNDDIEPLRAPSRSTTFKQQQRQDTYANDNYIVQEYNTGVERMTQDSNVSLIHE